MPNDEINRYMKMEKLLENKISRRFKVRRLEINDFGYLMEHLYGRDGIAYEDYEYQLPKKKLKKETLIKYYDLIRPTRCVIEESQRYLRLEHEDKESYVSYFTVNAIVGELDFPSSEIFYFQQQQFTFPVDTSMNVEIVENRKALTTVRNKKKELKDLDNHAYQAGRTYTDVSVWCRYTQSLKNCYTLLIPDRPYREMRWSDERKEKAKSSVSDFKRGMVQEQKSRQTGRLEKQEQHRQNIADKRMELQKAQEARQAQRKADRSATTGATRPHERPATASTIPKPSTEKTQEIKRPATATTSKASEPVKTSVIKERPLSSGASDRKATQLTQQVHRQNVEKVVLQETRQNYTKDRRKKVQQTHSVQKNQQTIEKSRNLVTKKGQKKK